MQRSSCPVAATAIYSVLRSSSAEGGCTVKSTKLPSGISSSSIPEDPMNPPTLSHKATAGTLPPVPVDAVVPRPANIRTFVWNDAKCTRNETKKVKCCHLREDRYEGNYQGKCQVIEIQILMAAGRTILCKSFG